MKKTKEYRLSFSDEAKRIVDGLTLEQKVGLMSGNMDMQHLTPEIMAQMAEMMQDEGNHYNVTPYEAGGIKEVGLPPMKFVDGPRGVVCGNWQTTCFPVSMARGATFSPELEEKVGHAIGRETRAFGGNLFAGVCINLPYNPGWGRSQETYGEETYQIGQMGAALVRGVQDEDIMACVKHYAFNDMENARFKCSVTCDQRTEKEVYLPHFKDCVDAGAASIMSSYNRYNGVYCGHHSYLLKQVLKNEWDFDGFVMSDFCWGVRDTIEAANGGQDMEMFWTQQYGERLVKAVEDGFVPMENIDDACMRIVRTILAFDKDHKEYDMSVVACPEHIALAKEVAEKSITLVKNENILPLDRAKTKKIAVIGKLGNEQNIGDHGSSWVRPPYVVTPVEGLKNANPESSVIFCDGSDLEAAKKAAVEADAVVFVVGYNHDDEGEFISDNQEENYTGAVGGDRKESLGLHKDEIELIKAVAPVNENNCVVLIGGNMIMMTEWFDDANSVIMAYYPGMEGANALAEIIYGDVNPSGKLPFVIPENETDLPYVDWEATDQYYEYYHGYTRLEKNNVKPLVPYGFGLSYTSYEFSEPSARKDGDNIIVSVKVKNSGSIAGEEVVQFYMGYENSSVDRPVKQLRGFKRVALAPGEEKNVEITTPLEKIKYYDPVHRQWVLEHMEYTVFVGDSADEKDLVNCKITI